MDVENKIDCFFEEHRDAFKGIRGIDAPYLKSFEDIDTPSDAPLSDVQKYIRDNFQHIAGTIYLLDNYVSPRSCYDHQ